MSWDSSCCRHSGNNAATAVPCILQALSLGPSLNFGGADFDRPAYVGGG